MNSLPSSEFKKTYPRLTEETEVTSNGHLIGFWTPVRAHHAGSAGSPAATTAASDRQGQSRMQPVKPADPAPSHKSVDQILRDAGEAGRTVATGRR